jgi:hypothetical protein
LSASIVLQQRTMGVQHVPRAFALEERLRRALTCSGMLHG